MFSILKQLGTWLLVICRLFIGTLIARTGIGLMQGQPYSGFDSGDSLTTGGFVLLIGVYIIFMAITSLIPHDT